MTFYVIIAALAVAVGVVVFIQGTYQQAVIANMVKGGWVYFLSAVGGEFDDPPAPVKIGYTFRDPAVDRLPEIETMSPQPLQVLYSFYTKEPQQMERAIHDELAPFRRHGEWFDRDAALAWLDNHVSKGAV